MKVYRDVSLKDFEFWGNAARNLALLSEEDIESLDDAFDQVYPEGLSETEVNDILAFDEDFVAQLLGYDTWEELLFS